jgi:hypothetical protein
MALTLLAAGFCMAISNPLPPYSISEYSTSPPWIELYCDPFYDSLLSGVVIHTMGGDAVIDSGVVVPLEGVLVLDSGNTSGFTLNSEGDSIVIPELFVEIAYGCMGAYSVPPLPNESAAWSYRHNASLNFCLAPSPGDWGHAAECLWGQTQVVINEVNSTCTWGTECRFVELFNRSASPVDISDWQIVCNDRYYIPSSTYIPAGGHYILDERLFPSDFGLSPNCDNVYLLDGSEHLVDQTGWSSNHGDDVSFMRFPNGGPDTMSFDDYTGFSDETSICFSDGFPSRGAPNRYQSPGLRIIGIRADTLGGYANIYWTNPIWLTVFDQAILRKSMIEFPRTPFDGDLIFEGREQEYLFDQITPGQTAYYTVFARSGCGDYSIPDSECQISVYMPLVGIEDEGTLPGNISLLECYPNPFNSTATISYSLQGSGRIELTIHNIAGQRVATLASGGLSAGRHRTVWDASGVSSGVYFARLSDGNRSLGLKITLLK